MTEEETVYDRIGKFHAHLDVCSQCRNHSFSLCSEGATLLKEAAESADPSMKRPPDTEQVNRSEAMKKTFERVYGKQEESAE